MKNPQLSLTLTIGLLALPTIALAQTVRSGSGANAAAITGVRDTFRVDLGGGAAAGANGSFGGVRREINWDGVPATQSAPNNLAANFFNVNSPRGAVFSTAGTGFMVSGATTDAGAGQPAAANFGNINATYTANFQTFSPQRLFTSLGSNVYDVSFFVPGTATPALVTGFGSIFTDVDILGATTIQYFDAGNASLGTFNVPVADLGLSFLGVFFPSAQVSRVRVTQGNVALGAGINDGGGNDVVVADDFIYGEPVANTAPEPGTLAFLALGGTLVFVRRRRVAAP
ncbi:PEP-CTERM sorting domain-containing protein [Armatimonas sp.]|uniref:PEP-CTERM sorting domain-containing protein n=1 Tax=Armatimonas sp. TaxID=1872638 RepID=UPI00374D1009